MKVKKQKLKRLIILGPNIISVHGEEPGLYEPDTDSHLAFHIMRTTNDGPKIFENKLDSETVAPLRFIKYWSIEHFEPDRDDLINGRITWSSYHQAILYLDSKQDVEGYWGTSRKATAVKKVNIDPSTSSYGNTEEIIVVPINTNDFNYEFELQNDYFLMRSNPWFYYAPTKISVWNLGIGFSNIRSRG